MYQGWCRLVRRCFTVVSCHPTATLLTYLVITVFSTAISLYLGMEIVSTDPQEGFETRGTEMAAERALLHLLEQNTKNRITRKMNSKARDKRDFIILGKNDSDELQQQRFDHHETSEGLHLAIKSNIGKLQYQSSTLQSKDLMPRQKRISEESSGTMDYNDYGNQPLGINDISSGCEQYYALGRYYPFNIIDLMSKVIFEIPSFDTLFTVETMKRLCRLDDILDKVYNKYSKKKELPYSFNLSHYALCMNSSYTKECGDLNQEDINKFKNEVLNCQGNTDKMSICNSNIGLQLKNYILEKDLTRDKSPVYVSAILNIPMSNGYDVDYYQDIHTALLDEFNDKITVKGLEMNVKSLFFQRQISYDCALATVSVLVVLMGVLLYTTNFILTIATFVCMMLSIGFAFFVYIFVCNINFFPFLNLLVIVISIVIGFDDLFLLVNHYRHYKSFYANGEAMINALEHCGKGMFVTSATTAAAFVCNLQSNILILKCFGVFAGLTIIANYIFAVTALPSLILLTDKINCKSQKLIARCMIFNRIRIFFVYHIPNVIYNYRKVIVFLAWLLLIISTLITVKYITLPQNNPMQLLRSDHLFEWFSEYNSDLFDYSYQGNRQMNIYVIWGVKPAQKVPLLDPRKFGEFTTDNTFKIDSLKDLQQFKDTLLYSKAVVNYKSATYDLPLWIEEFTEFVEEKNGTNFVLQDLLEEYVQYTPTFKFPDDYSMSIKDGPLFDHDNNFISYFIILPTHHSLSFSYKDIASFMITVRKLESKLRNKDEYSNPIVSPIPFISKMADLMNVIMVNTMVSVLISVVICMLVIFATTKDVKLAVISIWTIIIVVMGVVAFVLLLGWTINVVEAVIIVITIGLSFDYTLHVAVCFKSTPKYLSIPERISRTLELIFTPIFLSALTSALAGVVLLFSGTQPFYEIGVFLGTMASISFGGAVFGFCACVSYTN